MLLENYINKQKKLRKSLDFKQLREAGINHLQQLSGKLWSDYNTHDPGVTLLELLCYAITDLSYRCDFKIEDLLASNPENRIGDSPDFFEAHLILPSHPLTILDFRKILIDLPFIRNAWLEPAAKAEQTIYYDEINKELTYNQADVDGSGNEEVRINGLYNVWLEFAEDPELGNLNTEMIGFDIEIVDGEAKYPARVAVYFPHYHDAHEVWKNEMSLENVTLVMTNNPDPWYDFNVKSKVTHDENKIEELTLRVAVDAGDFNWKTKKTQVRKKISDQLKVITEEGIFTLFNHKQIKIKQHLEFIAAFLNQHRNLCEDFLSIKIIKPQEIAIEGEIGLSLDSDPHQVLAKALFDVHQHLNPSVRFYTLGELLDQQVSPENIFDGPLLKHGFLKDENLTPLRRHGSIFVSDILNVLISSNPEKIKYITNLRLSNYNQNIQISEPNNNLLQLHLPDEYKPVASVSKSRINCKKGDIYQTIDWQIVEELFDELVKAAEPDKSLDVESRLTLPEGRDRKTAQYPSIQDDLPQTYGTGWQGLPTDSSEERKALARQLKGYLLFFDQLFGNFLAQLANVKNIFSMDDQVARTYFEQALYQVPDVMTLLTAFIGDKSEETKPAALDEAWDLFVADPENGYLAGLRAMNEDEQTFLDRRNRFLDHLMARFNEQFTDYSLLMFSKHNQQAPGHLVDEKAAFLREYPLLSSQRAKAFIAKSADEVWDTNNVTGLEKRVSRMLGFSDYSRRFLAKGPFGNIQFYQEIDVDVIDEFRFRILSGENKILLSSYKHYRVIDKGYDIVFKVLEFGKNPANYKILPSKNGRFYFNLYDENDKILARRIQLFDSEAETQTAIDEVAEFITSHFVGIDDEPGEGFFVIEHLLLRPKYNEIIEGTAIRDSLLPRLRDDFGNITKEGKDPYSFRVTAIFPSQLKKFSDRNFKELAETTLRLETPAHVMPQVYFVNNLQLSRLEHAYKNWIELNALPIPASPTEKVTHLKKLNVALFELEGAMVIVPEEPDL